ncbi:MAG: acetyl-CoA carboxylase biotin carboxyl carrier protein [Ruminococcus sp.]|jgi:acetyl-CoA carboxylase biotin carboxyl carrier protein
METEQIIRLIETVSKSSLTEFEYSEGEVKLVLKAGAPASAPAAPRAQKQPAPENEGEREEFVDDGTWIKSPLVGTFYSAPAEDAQPFVQVGDTVKKGQVLGIIETMKLMNEIESDRDGVVTEIVIENEQVVEFGQLLFRVE